MMRVCKHKGAGTGYILASAFVAGLLPYGASQVAAQPSDDHGDRFHRDFEAYVSGIVSEVSCNHPRLSFQVVSAADGAVWTMELPAAPDGKALKSKHLSKGTDVAIAGWPSKDGANELAVVRMMVDGKPMQVQWGVSVAPNGT